MTPVELILVAISLGFDAFSVALGIGLVWHGPRQFFRLSWHFGLFQALMPLIGWHLGHLLSSLVKDLSCYLACSILVGIGSHMIWNTLKHDGAKSGENETDRTKGWSLILLSVATSIDAFGVGISLGLLESGIFMICLVIGITAAIMTVLGMWIGKQMSRVVDLKIEVVAGIVLIILGIKIALY